MKYLILSLFTLLTLATSHAQCPTATTQPQSATICGTCTNISTFVTTGGTNVGYKWQYYTGAIWLYLFNSLPVGATYHQSNDTLYLTQPPSFTGTYTYRCNVTATGCNVLNSNSFTITVQ